ncbi:ornithine carbamoyltransferase [Pichia kluyveri]|uniref:ornithine carbamoyltransferase n=1 Tax=Pichia kluyveri TaxID=36015 RepID=A0AAV5R0B9_PICKL|nr:ornithine carbamoyltransferase [Pichia kluyveri]
MTASNTIRHLISISDLTTPEFKSLVNRAAYHKKLIKSKQKPATLPLQGELAALLFTKRSTRTRISSEGAAAYFGAQPMFLGKEDIQLGVNESFYDTTKVISSMTSCIFARVNSHADIQQLCEHSSVPIINSLCDRYHPLQAICDLLTITENFNELKGLKLAWIGDSNNVINDLAIAAMKFGINVSIATPNGIEMEQFIIDEARKITNETGATLELTHDPKIAATDANILVTDTFVSMGEESQTKEKLKQFSGFQINNELTSLAKDDYKFMHCLPRHKEEVSDDVFYSDHSVVFPEAENRLYAAIATLEAFVINKGQFL